ncbi:MarR family winged helix-turn-helix transcriptional regulator [Novosphingobium mangrovi (ex Huang et al. 2023)]|uniref:MarR family transcriptional regulator n=1 Tax=Novosphingobium mangrovi (ex Huang et al. 2023) TaxID=2976432 RepID=A0ABT2I548_9SPHN|nr:MarR family transcriptional regulator [Novosphingobium mangrovi (ex Huang et al. 2023)]MCT2399935.1 MarR family transcriptional regulator [Novosphingobium mangrovi (ex Huang et al. 2023)]
MDDVDRILAQWQVARPDLDVWAMGPLGRLGRVSSALARRMEQTFARHGLNAAGFDVLATLRRTPPHALTAGELMAAMMITSGTVTNRIDQLAKAGLVERQGDETDGRRVVIRLTDEGQALIERAIVDHVATQTELLAGLDAEELAGLDAALRKLMAGLETGA